MELEGSHVGILGLGLMGGSVASGLSRWGKLGSLSAWDEDGQSLKSALSMGAISRAATSLEDLVHLSEVLILAVPMDLMVPLSRLGAPYGSGLKAVFDLSSVRGDIHHDLGEIWGEPHMGFHPMAGSERSGLDNASWEMLRGATVALVPGEGTGQDVVTIAHRLAQALDLRPMEMSWEDHDRAVAWVSHLPMVLATALSLGAGEAVGAVDQIPYLAAGGFRDTSRVACCSPRLLPPLLEHNGELGPAIDRAIEILNEIKGWDRSTAAQRTSQGASWRDYIVDGPGRSR